MWSIISCPLVELCFVRNAIIDYSEGQKVLKVNKNDAVNTPSFLQQKHNLQLLLHFSHQNAACRQVSCVVKLLSSTATQLKPFGSRVLAAVCTTVEGGEVPSQIRGDLECGRQTSWAVGSRETRGTLWVSMGLSWNKAWASEQHHICFK